MDYLFDMRSERPGYRLQRMELFNWGTFDSSDGRIHRFEPQGRTSLLVGHNGSGKSTLVDALLTLLVDSRTRNYNVAAGAKKTERTAKSYIKGAYNRTSDESQASVARYLRPKGNHLSAISAVFRDEQLDKTFTLTQVLYLKSDSDDRLYAIVDDERELKDVLSGLAKSDQVRDHLRQQGYQTTRAYNEYQGWLTKRTSMRGKAIDMFNQTVHVKDIQSLNEFIRKHMLEAHDWRDKVQRLVTHFDDLSLAHQELMRARRAEELLSPIERIGTRYRKQSLAMQKLEQQLLAATTFFADETCRLYRPEIERQDSRLQSLNSVIVRLSEDLKAKTEVIRQLRNEIDQAGGDRLKQIPEQIKTEQAHHERKKVEFRRFHDQLRVCDMKEVTGDQKTFNLIRGQLQAKQRTAKADIVELQEVFEKVAGEKASVNRELQNERDELLILERRRNNLPGHFTAIRGQICGDLNLDENLLPFAAELVAVSPDHRHWEASLEMVLRSFALSLLVPTRLYPKVRAYVERTRLINRQGEGQRLDYICVGQATDAGGDRIAPTSSLNKLLFKPRHDLSPWVRAEVNKRLDFHCCESEEEFNDVPRMAMTANRHVKFNSERHQKDDRSKTVDPRYFVLGWDNSEKKLRIAQNIVRLENELSQLTRRAAGIGIAIQQHQDVERAAAAALALSDFDSIDVKRHQDAIASLEVEKRELEESNDAVKSLRKRLVAVEHEEAGLSKERDDRIGEKGGLEKDISNAKKVLERSEAEIEDTRIAGHFEKHSQWFESIRESLGEPPLSIDTLPMRQSAWQREADKQLTAQRKPLEELSGTLVSRMVSYRNEFPEHAVDVDAKVEALDSFMGLLEQLRREDLPRYEKKFKDRLNDQVSQEVGLFSNELRQECKRIESKVEQLNQALAEVEYNRGTLMRLEPRRIQDREIDQFRRSLSECLDEALEQSDEAYEARFLRIQALVQRLADKDRSTWRNKVIDVRSWFDFAAQEVDAETGRVRGCYDGSSGQSGGEKAKLAFTILVAALAYQFDVDPNGNTPGRFQFVVVDEMFSKVDDQNAVYALKLFKQFGLQLLIVAPLDAKARITEPFVDRYLHAVKDCESSRSQLFSMTAQEYEVVAKSFTAP